MAIIGDVLIDGTPVPPADAVVPVSDVALIRGFGVFEAMRSYDGVLFRVGPHLDRLAVSASRLGIDLPDRSLLERWCVDRGSVGDVIVRLLVTGGVDIQRPGHGGRVIVFAEERPPARESVTLTVRSAPWHADGSFSELVGAKTLSYAPNMAVMRTARSAGFDLPILVGRSGRVLEGPHFSVAWVIDGTVETPGLDLGILASITRQAMLDVARTAGVATVEGAFPLERMTGADEVFAMSTALDITPVTLIDDVSFPTGETTRRLQEAFTALVAAERS